MSDFDDFDDSEPLSDFQQGAEDVSNIPIIHIDPNAFDGLDVDLTKKQEIKASDVTPEHIETMKDILEDQAPGITKTLNDDIIEGMIVKSVNTGPFADTIKGPDGSNMCIVNDIQNSIDSEYAIKQVLSGGQLKDTGSIKTDLSDIQYGIGVHEGEHCNDDLDASKELDGADKDAAILESEINADKKSIEMLDQNRGVDYTEDLTTMRTLVSASDKLHATGISLDDTTPIDLSDDQAEAAAIFLGVQHEAVAEELGISSLDVSVLQATDPDKYNETVDKLIDNGTFNADLDPDANEYVEDYIKALRDEQIKQEESQATVDEQAKVESQATLETEQLAQEEQDQQTELEATQLVQEQEEIQATTDAEVIAQTDLDQQLEQEEQQKLAEQIVQIDQDQQLEQEEQQLQQDQDAALANDTSMATSAPNLLAVTNLVTTPSSESLAGMVPLGAGVSMDHGEDIAASSSILAGGEPIGDYFGEAANETASLDRIQQAQQMQLAMSNAPTVDTSLNNPIGGMSEPSTPSMSAQS